MKSKTRLILSLNFLTLAAACGPGLDYAVQPGGIRVVDKNSDLAGYWVNDVGGPLLYVPDLEIYVPIYLESGKFRVADTLEFDTASCTGLPITSGHPVGTVFESAAGKYYEVTSKSAPTGLDSVSSASRLDADGTTCTSTTVSIPQDPHVSRDVLTETTLPRDFTALAPMTLVLPQ